MGFGIIEESYNRFDLELTSIFTSFVAIPQLGKSLQHGVLLPTVAVPNVKYRNKLKEYFFTGNEK